MSILSAIREWPWRRIAARMLFGVAVLVTIVALFYAEERWRWRRAWLQYATDAETRGVQLETVNDHTREIPDELNAAKAPYFSSELSPHARAVLDRLKGLRIISSQESGIIADLSAAKADLIAHGLLDEDSLTPEQSLEELFERDFGAALRDLAAAANRPYFDSSLSERVDFLEAFQLSAMYAEVLIANGKADSAIEALSTMFRLGNLIDQEPNLMNAIVKVLGVGLVIAPIWHGMATHIWDDSNLAKLSASFAQVRTLESYRKACLGERQIYNGAIRQFLGKGLEEQWWPRVGPKWVRPLWSYYPRGWIYRSQLMANRFFDKREQSINLAEGTINLAVRLQPDTSKTNPIRDALWLPAVGNGSQFSSLFANAELGIRLASTAVALERYHLEHREYPENLDALLQRSLLRSLPRSPSDGSSVQYTRDGFNNYKLSGSYMELEQIGLGPITKHGKTMVWRPQPH